MIKFTDNAPIGMIRDTTDGYMVAMSRIARTGVQEYRASELGIIGDHIVRVMRTEDSVFAKDAMSSLSHAPVTINHPTELVDANNWKDLAVGEVGEGVMRDGEWLSAPLILKDAVGVNAARSTHKEISLGYTAEIKDAPEGADYDLEMTDIKFNHLAIVPRGRAGSEARIGDSALNWGASPQPQKEPVQMDMKPIMIGDAAFNVPLADAEKIETAVNALKQEITDRDAALGEHIATITNLEAKILTDEQRAQDAIELVAVIDRARLFDAKIDVTGKSAVAIKREALSAVYDVAMIASAPDVSVGSMFDILEPQKVNDSAREVLKNTDKKPKNGNDPWATFNKKDDK